MNEMKIQWRVISTMGDELYTAKFDDRDDADECAREIMKSALEPYGTPEVRIVREATRVERLPVWVPAVPVVPGRKYVPALTTQRTNPQTGKTVDWIIKAEIPAIPDTPEVPGYWKMAAIP